MWGINGHPVQGGPYTTISYATQMAGVSAAGMKTYRMDLYDASPTSLAVLTSVLAAATTAGIIVVPDLIPNVLAAGTETNAYTQGYAIGQTYAAAYPTIRVWELGNEWELAVGAANPASNPDGHLISQYDQTKYALARGALRGMAAGIKAANHSALVAIGTAGVCHYGFTDGLWADGVRWDITVEHWYSLAGDITNMAGFCTAGPINKAAVLHSHYGKPIWITEFNDNANPANKTEMADKLVSMMTQWNGIATTYDIESGVIYELYDQPAAPVGIEQHFGVVSASGTINAAGTAVVGYLSTHPSKVYTSRQAN